MKDALLNYLNALVSRSERDENNIVTPLNEPDAAEMPEISALRNALQGSIRLNNANFNIEIYLKPVLCDIIHNCFGSDDFLTGENAREALEGHSSLLPEDYARSWLGHFYDFIYELGDYLDPKWLETEFRTVLMVQDPSVTPAPVIVMRGSIFMHMGCFKDAATHETPLARFIGDTDAGTFAHILIKSGYSDKAKTFLQGKLNESVSDPSNFKKLVDSIKSRYVHPSEQALKDNPEDCEGWYYVLGPQKFKEFVDEIESVLPDKIWVTKPLSRGNSAYTHAKNALTANNPKNKRRY